MCVCVRWVGIGMYQPVSNSSNNIILLGLEGFVKTLIDEAFEAVRSVLLKNAKNIEYEYRDYFKNREIGR